MNEPEVLDDMSRPSFVYLFCDELRCDALSCYGGLVPTPNIDRLALSGQLFENAFCTSPVCVASRFSILTSAYPEETGVYHNEAAYPAYPVVEGFDTFVNALERAGYQTASFGKTHIPRTATPVFGYENPAGGEMSLGLGPGEAENVFKPAGSFKSVLAADYPEGKPYRPSEVTKNGLAWISRVNGPFFARLSYLQPHTPIIVPRSYVERVPEELVRGSVTPCETSLFERRFSEVCDIATMPDEDLARVRRYYQGLVLWIDDQVGEVLDAIESRDDREDVVVIFHADHGASRGEGGMLAKQVFAPQSHRVPLIVSCPGRVKPGRRRELCDGLDVGPTVLALAGVACPAAFRGVDLMRGGKERSFSTIGYGEVGSRAFPNKAQGTYVDGRSWPRRSCVRTQRYRLDMNVRMDGVPIDGGDDWFFCDYVEDPAEARNRVDEPQFQSVVRELAKELLEHGRGSVEVLDPTVLERPRMR